MTNPNIVFTKPNVAELVDCPIPAPQSGEVRVRLVRSCLSSGTERANLVGVPDGGVGIFATGDGVTWPRQCGYSSSGIVDAVGADVDAMKVGDRVALSWSKHAQFVSLPVSQVYPIPDGVSFADAAFAHIATFPLAAIRKCRLELGEGALVMGQGVLGQLAVLLLRAAGATPVIAADPDAAKRVRALELGADAALDPSAPDFAARAKALCPADRRVMGGRVDASGPKVGIEVTGVGMALNGVLDAIAPFGRIALLGCTRDANFTIDYYHKVHGRGVTLVGAHTLARPDGESAPCWWTTRDDARAFLSLLAHGRLSLDGFVDEVHAPEACGEVYARLAAGGAFPVVQFDWEENRVSRRGAESVCGESVFNTERPSAGRGEVTGRFASRIPVGFVAHSFAGVWGEAPVQDGQTAGRKKRSLNARSASPATLTLPREAALCLKTKSDSN